MKLTKTLVILIILVISFLSVNSRSLKKRTTKRKNIETESKSDIIRRMYHKFQEFNLTKEQFMEEATKIADQEEDEQEKKDLMTIIEFLAN